MGRSKGGALLLALLATRVGDDLLYLGDNESVLTIKHTYNAVYELHVHNGGEQGRSASTRYSDRYNKAHPPRHLSSPYRT